MLLTLLRLSSTLDCVRGIFLYDEIYPLCHSLELPWLENHRNVSCIPSGTYKVTKGFSNRFAECFYLHNVPGRSGILIHPGNSVKDTQGCILPGLDTTPSGVLHSRDAIKKLYTLPSEFKLIVR